MKVLLRNPWFARSLTAISSLSLCAALFSSIMHTVPGLETTFLADIDKLIGPTLSFGVTIEMIRKRIQEWSDRIEKLIPSP